MPKGCEFKEGGQDYFLFESKKRIDEPQKLLDTFGGTIRIIELKATVQKGEVLDAIFERVKEKYVRKGSKVSFGLTFYSKKYKPALKVIFGTLKKRFKSEKISSRFVNTRDLHLNAGVVWHERLLEKGCEIVVFDAAGLDNQYLIGETVAIQDINAYSLRDYEKPHRDMQQGIMPPKLCQIILNIAGVKSGSTIWDPFVGSGVIAMEALLLGHNVLGSDISKDAFFQSEDNIVWLRENMDFGGVAELFVHDATKPVPKGVKFDAIVTESYLGPTIRGQLTEERVRDAMRDVERIYLGFFKQIRESLKSSTPIVITFPFFRLKGRDIFLKKTLEKVLALGYTAECPIDPKYQRLSGLTCTERNSLLYFRKDQKVGREVFKFKVQG